MSRRRLEEAVCAGQQIEQGKALSPTDCRGLEIIKDVEFDPAKGPVYSLQFSHDGNLLAVGYGNGGIELFDSQTGNLKHVVRRDRYGGFQIMCLRFHPKYPNILFATTSDGKIFTIDTSAEEPEAKEEITEKNNEINCLDFDEDGFYFATGGKDLAVRLYDATTKEVLNTYEGYSVTKDPSEYVSGCALRIWALKYVPDNGYMLITGGWENHLKIWDTRSKDPVKRIISGPHICGDGLDIKMKGQNRYDVLTGSWRNHNALQEWNYSEDYGPSSKKKPKEIDFRGHPDKGQNLYCAQYCNDHVVMAGGSGTNSCQAINMETNELLGEVKFEGAVIALDTAKNGERFAIGSMENRWVMGRLCQ